MWSDVYNGLRSNNILVGKNSVVESYSGAYGHFGCVLNLIELGEDSIIKGSGNASGMYFLNEEAVIYPMYGGVDSSELYELALGRFTYMGIQYSGALNGESPAKYIEIGPLLTINIQLR